MNEIATTERIRELFTDGGFWNSDVFDEWLEQHDAEVAKATEERIIKLLRTTETENPNDSRIIAHLMFLITGEVNE